jgi:uncharacterized membrane protein
MKAVVLAIAAGLCWGVGEVCAKSVLHSGRFGPFSALAIRSTVALPLIWLAYLVAAKALRAPAELTPWGEADGKSWGLLLIGSGVVAGAMAIIFFYAAMNVGEISRVKPIAFALAPATAVLLGWLALGESMGWRKALALGLILAGVVLLTLGGGPSRPPAGAA